MLPIYILRYIYGGAFAFNEDIAITYVDYLDMVARWDTGIDATPPTLLDYTDVETLLSDAYGVYQDAYVLVNGFLETLVYAQKIGSSNGSILSQLIDALQKEQSLHYLNKDEDLFLYSITVDGQSSLVLNAAYFTGFTNYTDLVTLFNLYSYEQLLNYGYEWLYTVGQFLGEVFTIEDARGMINEVYDNEIKDLSYPLPDVDFISNFVVDTYANIATLASSGLLNLSYLYQINDNTDAEGGNVVLKPISNSEFSAEGTYIPSYDNTQSWFCIYDFPNNEIVELRDLKSNIVLGNNAINGFVWDNVDVHSNLIHNPNTFSLSVSDSAQFFGNHFYADTIGDITISDNAIVKGNYINGENAELSVLAGGFSYIQSNFIIGYYAKLDVNGDDNYIGDNIISGGSVVTIACSNLNFYYNQILNTTLTLTNVASNVINNIFNQSTITIENSTTFNFSTNEVNGSTVSIDDSNTTVISDNIIENSSTLTLTNNDNINVRKNRISISSTLTVLDSTGGTIDSNIIEQVADFIITISSGNILYNKLSQLVDVTVTNSTVVSTIRYNNFTNFGNIIITESDADIEANNVVNSVLTIDDLVDVAPDNAASFYSNEIYGGNISITNCDNISFQQNVINESGIAISNSTEGKIFGNRILSGSTLTVSSMNTDVTLFTKGINYNELSGISLLTIDVTFTGAVLRNILKSGSRIFRTGAITISGDIIENELGNSSDVNFTATHAGTFNQNSFRGGSAVTAGANGGVNHQQCIMNNSTHAFAAAVSETGTRDND